MIHTILTHAPSWCMGTREEVTETSAICNRCYKGIPLNKQGVEGIIEDRGITHVGSVFTLKDSPTYIIYVMVPVHPCYRVSCEFRVMLLKICKI